MLSSGLIEAVLRAFDAVMARLFHVSDIHFGSEDRAAIDWFARTVAEETPDAVIMTGDLTMRARTREFAAAGEWLASLGVPVTVEVGNHDLTYFNPFERLLQPYRRYKRVERMVERPLDIAGVAVVPLRTTSRFQFRLDWSKGNVRRRQLRKTLRLLDALDPHDAVIVACHHPLVDQGTQSTAETTRGDRALTSLAGAGADAVLTGHVHDPFDVEYRIDGRAIRLIGAGTLSTRTRDTPPSFNELRIERGRIETIVRTMDAAPDRPMTVSPGIDVDG